MRILKRMPGIIITILLLFFSACDNFVKIGPPQTEITGETVFSNDITATSVMRGVYSQMMTDQAFCNGALELYTGLSSDDLTNYSSNNEQQQFYLPALSKVNQTLYNYFWSAPYRYINNANSVLEGIANPNGLTATTANQLKGEALFVRAFCHFYLVNLFGDVPFITSTDYRVNSVAARTPAADVYQKIILDLLSAQALLTDDFSFSGGERTVPNKGAATALLARVYLYTGDWPNAEVQASQIINNTANYSLPDDLNTVFLANSNETIWQLHPVIPGINTFEGQYFILYDNPAYTYGGVALSSGLYNSFEDGDKRLVNWIGVFNDGISDYYFAYKYKIDYNPSVTEYQMVFRLAEQYLIRAEARAQQNALAASIADIDIIRNRAGLPLINDTNPSIDKADLLLAIEQERRVELFTEMGHRWLDLKRTHRADAVLAAVKTDWQPTDVLYPVPQSEISVDPNLTQNTGY